ncbi:MAG: sensor histidine kinase [Bacteroidia bacterium]|nr:sensor histidine kinase [Bacteroidia bacterium]
MNKLFIAAIAGLLVLIGLIYRIYKSRHKLLRQEKELQQQKITDLEKDKQLLTIEAMLKGQEEERNRIAKDLHDGLGGMLSGTKLSFINFREELILTPNSERRFVQSVSMLDNTIGELRKVAHNLMPEVLLRFGLEEALRDFCSSIQASSGIKVIYQQLGNKRKIETAAETAVYRIVQELVNNALKHAGATQIVVQLTMHNDKTTVTVEDNGKGFDSKQAAGKGAGLLNIRHRVNYFKGNIDIDSEQGNGTSVTIELRA